MKPISIFGTSSDAGKSTITFVIAKLIQNMGFTVAPFKAQNVSNNAHVADDGSEISIAQYFQAEVLGIPTSYHLNPVLLKSGKNNKASIIVKGKVADEKDVHAYYQDLDLLKPSVDDCLNTLLEQYDCVVCEGAGSPVELNLMDKDLSNIYIAEKFNTKIILVADIERGGVFASIWGVYNLLPEKLRKNVIGVVINKFRGDISLFDEGITIIENQFHIPVLGILPYDPINLGFEDSASLMNYTQTKPCAKLRVGVIAYPGMSNYNDLEPLISDSEVLVEFIASTVPLHSFDLIILPGSKKVISDLHWLKQNGLYEQLTQFQGHIYGICGGFEMMHLQILDPYGVECETNTSEKGFGWVDDKIIFETDKHLTKGCYTVFGQELIGFEMHNGRNLQGKIDYEKGKIKGSFVHGIFENDPFRTAFFKAICHEYNGYNFQEYKRNRIDSFIDQCANKINLDKVLSHVL